MSSTPSSSEPPSCTTPDGAACWLCLEEGPDDTGAPLVRDCSCRGYSGFAHLPCLIKYAESKSRDCVEREGIQIAHHGIFFEEKFFSRCPNCKQSFQGDIAYDLTKAQLSFIAREFRDVAILNLSALMRRIGNLYGAKEADRIEGEDIIDKILTLIEVEDDMGNCKPSVAVGYMSLAVAYQYIGRFYFNVGDEISLKKAKYYYEKARDACTCNTLGDGETHGHGAFINNSIKKTLAKIEAAINGESLEAEILLSNLRESYEHLCQNKCEHDIVTLQYGVKLAEALFGTDQTVEAIRLLDKLVVTSRRVHGASHKQTKVAEKLWQRLKIRYVMIEEEFYRALRYENDENSYVVNGPVPSNLLGELRSVDDGTTFSVPNADIILGRGTPVVLHGLKKAAHLNDEIGDVRDLCQLSGRWVVHLEGKGLKPVKVKQENLHIVFDLPDPKK